MKKELKTRVGWPEEPHLRSVLVVQYSVMFGSGIQGALFPIRLRFSCGNIFGKQIGNVFVFTICFDVGLAVIVLKMTTNLEITYEPI